MRNRYTKGLKGFEVLNPRQDDISHKIQYLENFYGNILVKEVIVYFTKYQPVDIETAYDTPHEGEEVGIISFVESQRYIRFETIYDIDEVVNRIKVYDDEIQLMQILPLAGNYSFEAGDIGISLAANTLGKIYFIDDYFDFKIKEAKPIANNINEFISKLEVLSVEQLKNMTYYFAR